MIIPFSSGPCIEDALLAGKQTEFVFKMCSSVEDITETGSASSIPSFKPNIQRLESKDLFFRGSSAKLHYLAVRYVKEAFMSGDQF